MNPDFIASGLIRLVDPWAWSDETTLPLSSAPRRFEPH
jgi:hypothetical protein